MHPWFGVVVALAIFPTLVVSAGVEGELDLSFGDLGLVLEDLGNHEVRTAIPHTSTTGTHVIVGTSNGTDIVWRCFGDDGQREESFGQGGLVRVAGGGRLACTVMHTGVMYSVGGDSVLAVDTTGAFQWQKHFPGTHFETCAVSGGDFLAVGITAAHNVSLVWTGVTSGEVTKQLELGFVACICLVF
jgi:hypothetical protein